MRREYRTVSRLPVIATQFVVSDMISGGCTPNHFGRRCFEFDGKRIEDKNSGKRPARAFVLHPLESLPRFVSVILTGRASADQRFLGGRSQQVEHEEGSQRYRWEEVALCCT